MRIPTVALLLAGWITASANAFSLPKNALSSERTGQQQPVSKILTGCEDRSCHQMLELSTTISRRTWMTSTMTQALGMGAGALSLLLSSQPAYAADTNTIPTVTTDEFLLILRDSARSIKDVEFTGPKSETVVVKLADGTAFGIRDVVESPTDPRSPLKIAAYCRENQVPTRFLTIEQALASAPKRKKVYTNERVAEANAKEQERRARMEQDEQARLAELYRLQQQQGN